MFVISKLTVSILLSVLGRDRTEGQFLADVEASAEAIRKMPEAGLKIAQKGLKHVFYQNFAEAPSLARAWVGYLGFCGGLTPPQTPRTRMCASIRKNTSLTSKI